MDFEIWKKMNFKRKLKLEQILKIERISNMNIYKKL
jgi:hypothetical protein